MKRKRHSTYRDDRQRRCSVTDEDSSCTYPSLSTALSSSSSSSSLSFSVLSTCSSSSLLSSSSSTTTTTTITAETMQQVVHDRLKRCVLEGQVFYFDQRAREHDEWQFDTMRSHLNNHGIIEVNQESAATFVVTTDKLVRKKNEMVIKARFAEFMKKHNNNPMLVPVIANGGKSAGARMLIRATKGRNRFAREFREYLEKRGPMYVTVRSVLQTLFRVNKHVQLDLNYRAQDCGTLKRAVRVSSRRKTDRSHVLKKRIRRDEKIRDGIEDLDDSSSGDGSSGSSSSGSISVGSGDDDNGTAAVAVAESKIKVEPDETKSDKGKSNKRRKSPSLPSSVQEEVVGKDVSPFIRVGDQRHVFKKRAPRIGFDRRRLDEYCTPFYATLRFKKRTPASQLYCHICETYFENHEHSDSGHAAGAENRYPHNDMSHLESEIHARNMELMKQAYLELDSMLLSCHEEWQKSLCKDDSNQHQSNLLRHDRFDVKHEVHPSKASKGMSDKGAATGCQTGDTATSPPPPHLPLWPLFSRAGKGLINKKPKVS